MMEHLYVDKISSNSRFYGTIPDKRRLYDLKPLNLLHTVIHKSQKTNLQLNSSE